MEGNCFNELPIADGIFSFFFTRGCVRTSLTPGYLCTPNFRVKPQQINITNTTFCLTTRNMKHATRSSIIDDVKHF